MTEVTGEGLHEGMEVVTGEITGDSSAAAGSTNPFGPPQWGRSSRSGSGGSSGGSSGRRSGF